MERGLAPSTSIVRMAQFHAIVGLELAVRSFAGGLPLRDAAHAQLLLTFQRRLHRSWRFATEVPLPIATDQRAWDALISLSTCRYGVEVETAPRDGQALVRRLQLKVRDGGVDGVLLVLPATRRNRDFLSATGPLLAPLCPVPGARALELLAAGVDPGGGAIVRLDQKGMAA